MRRTLTAILAVTAAMVTAAPAHVLAFFDRYLRHQHRGLLSAPSPCYPEMRFVR